MTDELEHIQWQVSRDHKTPRDWTWRPGNNKKVKEVGMLNQKRVSETIIVVLKILKCCQDKKATYLFCVIQGTELRYKLKGSNL